MELLCAGAVAGRCGNLHPCVTWQTASRSASQLNTILPSVALPSVALQWEAVSESAKAMITQMLEVDEHQRSTAAQLLKVGPGWLALGWVRVAWSCGIVTTCATPEVLLLAGCWPRASRSKPGQGVLEGHISSVFAVVSKAPSQHASRSVCTTPHPTSLHRTNACLSVLCRSTPG